MSFLGSIFGQKKTIDKPIFIKDFCNDNTQLKDLENLFDKLRDGEKKDIDIVLGGELGLEQVLNELCEN